MNILFILKNALLFLKKTPSRMKVHFRGPMGFTLVEVVVSAALVGIVAYITQTYRGTERRNHQKRDFLMSMLHIKDVMIGKFSISYHLFPPIKGKVYYSCYGETNTQINNKDDYQDFGLWPAKEVSGPQGLFSCIRRRGKQGGLCTMPGKDQDGEMCPGARFVGFLEPDDEYLHVRVVSFEMGTREAISRLATTMPRNSGY